MRTEQAEMEIEILMEKILEACDGVRSDFVMVALFGALDHLIERAREEPDFDMEALREDFQRSCDMLLGQF